MNYKCNTANILRFDVAHYEDNIKINVFQNQQLVGSAELIHLKEFNRRNLFLLNKLFISPCFRRQGFGSKLIEYVCQYVDINNIELICDAVPSCSISEVELVCFYFKYNFKHRDSYFLDNSIITCSGNEFCALIRNQSS